MASDQRYAVVFVFGIYNYSQSGMGLLPSAIRAGDRGTIESGLGGLSSLRAYVDLWVLSPCLVARLRRDIRLHMDGSAISLTKVERRSVERGANPWLTARLGTWDLGAYRAI